MELASWTLFSRLKCLLKGPPQVSLPKMTFVKNLLMTWCPKSWGDNSRLFSTWWMRSPLCPSELRLQPSQRRKMRPLSILCTPFSWKWPLHAQRQTHTDTHTHCEVGTGQRCSPQRGRLTSENSLSKALGSYTSLGETANEKARGPGQKFFFSPFQGKMPRAIKIASSNWMEKADVPYSGLREVRAERNAFRNALRDM